jgi:glycosyltransferase involved in cell wall biosynthesis
VVFAGKIPPDDLPHTLAAADVLLSPRLTGVNTPLKILDYMKAGRAIVATDTPANRLLLDETRAFMAEATPTTYAAAIAAACCDDVRRADVASQGLELVKTTYSFDAFKAALLECYETALRN